MAFVAYYQNGEIDFACSGTVISPNVVLTAGHCGEDEDTGVPYQASGYAVVTSSLDWSDAASRQVSTVSRVIVFPGYDPTIKDDGDAALLVLSAPTSAPSIPLASDPGDLALLDPGTGADIAGWGETAFAPLVTQLQWGQDVVQSPSYCAQEAAVMGAGFDDLYQTCAIDAPSDADGTCSGDSGGPLVAQRPDETWVEIGVTSLGPADCYTGLPDFFTRADAIESWADSWIAAVAPPPAPPAPSPPPPTPSPSSPAATPHPLPGLYHGQTSQHRRITLRVGSAALALTALKFGFGLRCTRHRALSFVLTATAPRWGLTSGLDLTRRFEDTGGTRFRTIRAGFGRR